MRDYLFVSLFGTVSVPCFMCDKVIKECAHQPEQSWNGMVYGIKVRDIRSTDMSKRVYFLGCIVFESTHLLAIT